MAIELVTATGVVLIADLLAYREYLRYKYALDQQKSNAVETNRNTLALMTTINSEINEPIATKETPVIENTQTNVIPITPDRVETVFIPDYSSLAQLQTLRNENTKLKAQLASNPNWDKLLTIELNKASNRIDELSNTVTSTKNKLTKG